MSRIKYILIFAVTLLFVVGTDAYAQSTKQRGKIKTSESESEVVKPKAVKKSNKTSSVQQVAMVGRQYLFGVAISYSDSVTMVTNICPVDNMAYDKRTKSPIGLDLYTESFKSFLLRQGKVGYMCSTFVCKSMKDAEKKVIALREKVNKKKETCLQPVGDFKYEYINMEHIFSNVGQPDDDDDF